MKQIKCTFLILILFAMSCKEEKKEISELPEQTETINKTVSLESLWKTETTLTTSEGVVFNANKNVIYVSNIGAVPPNVKDGDGTLSIIDVYGKVLNQNWVTGLNAPKGMAIFNSKLYVADIDEVVKVDIESGNIDKRIKIEGALFLNDVAVDKDGTFYVTDTYGNKIHKIINDKASTWKTFTDFNPNGILVEENRIVSVSYSNGNFIAINKNTKEETLLANAINGGDGIVPIEKGYLVSNWSGEVYYVANDLNGEAATLILDTKEAKINAADIAIIPERNILLVPTFFVNTVDAYQINIE